MKPPPFRYHAPASIADALALLASLEDARVLAGAPGALSAAASGLRNVAHHVVRNRGTVCGSLAHADPAAELPGRSRSWTSAPS